MLSDLAVKRRSLPNLDLPAIVIAEGRDAIALRWLLSRALVLALLVHAREDGVAGDVLYYATSLHQLFSGAGLGNTLQEYPLPVLSILLPPFLLGALN